MNRSLFGKKDFSASGRQARSKDVSSVIQEPDILCIVGIMKVLFTSGSDDVVGGASRVSVQG